MSTAAILAAGKFIRQAAAGLPNEVEAGSTEGVDSGAEPDGVPAGGQELVTEADRNLALARADSYC